MKNMTHKLIKIGLLFVLALGLSVTLDPQDVSATLGNPVIEAYVMENGVSVPLGSKIATSTVTLKSNVPVIFYLYDNAITETYTTSTTIQGGYSKDGFKYYGIDQMGRASAQITVKMDYNQAPILTGITSPAGLMSVTLDAMKDSYFVVNGVKSSEMSLKKTFTALGDYTVYAESHDGLKSNVMTFSIPTKAAVVTTTTLKPPVTTKKPTSTGPVKTTTTVAGTIPVSLEGVVDGGMTNQDVVLSANENVFFIVNGIRESTAAKSITLTKEGTYTITAENAKKNSSQEITFVIDKTTPVIVLEINGEEQTPGIFTEPVTIRSDEQGVFYVNGEETYGSNNAITISESGTYTIEFLDQAQNKTSVDFVLNIDSKTDEPSKSGGDTSWLLYLIIGLIAGAGVALGGSYLINKKNQG